MRRTFLLFVLVGTLAFVPATAWGSGADVIKDCTDNGRIDEPHGPKDYQEALAALPSDVDEYTDCRSIISAASRNPPQSGGSGGAGGNGNGGGGNGGGGGGGGGGKGGGGLGGGGRKAKAAAKPAKSKLAAVKPVPKGPPIVPAPSTLARRPLNHGVPTPLIVTLAVLGLALLAWLLASARGLKPPVPVSRAVHRVFPRRA